MLEGVIRRVAHVRFGIDAEPWLARGGQDIARVQIGEEQDRPRLGVSELSPEPKALRSDLVDSVPTPGQSRRLEFFGPAIAHLRQGTKRMAVAGIDPDSPRHRCDHRILFRLG